MNERPRVFQSDLKQNLSAMLVSVFEYRLQDAKIFYYSGRKHTDLGRAQIIFFTTSLKLELSEDLTIAPL